MIYFFIATVFLLPTVYFDIRPSHQRLISTAHVFLSLHLFLFLPLPSSHGTIIDDGIMSSSYKCKSVTVHFKAIALYFAGTFFLIAKCATK